VNLDLAVELYREMLRTAVIVSAPILGAALVMGLLVSFLQTITSINEHTLSFVPKIAAIALVIGALLPWILTHLMAFLRLVLAQVPALMAVQ
jgi:flagellar biosynthetic protein FliQ